MNHRLARPLLARLVTPAALLLLFACGGETADGDAVPADAPAAAGTTGAATQGDFEGVIHVTTFDEGESSDGVLRIKGDRWRFETEMEGERAALVRGRDGRIFSVSERERLYAWFPEMPAGDEPMQFEATNETETVAGYQCRYYRVRDPDNVQDGDEVCVTTDLGFAGMGPGAVGAGVDDAAIRRQFRDGFLILRSRNAQGGVEYEVTRVERTAVPDDMFEPPAGYTEMGRR
jgi:hypothetical protein